MSESVEIADGTVRVSVDEMTRFVTDILVQQSVPHESAAVVADCLVFANRSGIDSHGVVRLAHYVRRLDQGSIRARPEIRFQSRAAAIGHVSGDHGLGHVVSDYATDRVMELAKSNGIGAVSVGDSSHFGMAAFYAVRMASEQLIGICMTATDKFLVPFGAKEPFFGTNPICFSFPGDPYPIVLDMATTAIPYGKVALAQVEDRSIPETWAVNDRGEPTTDPNDVVGLFPAAGPKGSGLAMVIDIFSSVLSQMPWGPHITKMYGDLRQPRRLGHFFMAIDIERFLPNNLFRQTIGTLIGELTGLDPAEGFEAVQHPGQREAECRDRRDRTGLPIEQGLRAELDELAAAARVLPLRI